MKIQEFTRKPAFWVLQLLIFVICSYLAILFYPKAFPIVDLNIKMDRHGALQAASLLATQHRWGPTHFKQTTAFDQDQTTQTFIELFGGGKSAFAKVLKEGLYSPYTWNVRHYAEGKTQETLIRFTPEGNFYGFQELLAETDPGPALPAESARKIAETTAVQDWGVRLADFKWVEKSQETRPSQRIDHTFVYERPEPQVGEGRYRMRLVVSGDRLTELTHFIKIPNEFLRKYAEMRSANNTIASLASVAMSFLYVLCGCGLGVYLLARKHWLIWKPAVLFGFIVALFQFLEQLNQFPLNWMNYDTALSESGYLLKQIASSLVMFLIEFALLSVSFMAAESLGRRAFPHHLQFWRIWIPRNASSIAILGRTVGGYLSVGFFFSFVVFMYLFGVRILGWWTPSDTWFQPNSLASYCPWFTSISQSLHAGFWEESLFRAVPIAGAALIGESLGHRKKWLTAGFIIQSIIFAAAHANYPAQPSYARIIELIFPSLFFGSLYLFFGLLPGIILHYTFDVISFAIPIFSANTPGIWMDKLLIVGFSLTPLWIVLVARFQQKKWNDLSNSETNGAWSPPEMAAASASETFPKSGHLRTPGTAVQWIIVALGFIGLSLWLFIVPIKNDSVPLEIDRHQAIALSRTALVKSGIQLTSDWQALAVASSGVRLDDRFIWRTEGPTRYKELLGTYLTPPSWTVRFVRFDTDVAERAEEYRVEITEKGSIYRIRHDLPERRKGASLEESQAKTLALANILKNYKLSEAQLKLTSNISSKLPHRKDWLFVFSDQTVPLKKGEARIGVRISGDQVTASQRYIFVPEDWLRNERNHQNLMSIVKIFSTVTMVLIFGIGIIYALVHRSRRAASSSIFRSALLLLATIGLFNLVNDLPSQLASFSTAEPFSNQIITYFAVGIVTTLFFSVCAALVIDYFDQNKTETNETHGMRRTLMGYSLGIIGTVIPFLLTRLFPTETPRLGKLEALNNYVPQLAGFDTLNLYVMLVLLFSLVAVISDWMTHHWTKRIIFAVILFILFGFALSGSTASSLREWAIMGTAFGIITFFTYRFLIFFKIELFPIAVSSMVALLEYRQIVMNPYPNAALNSGIGILMVISAGLFWYKKLKLPSR